MFIPRHYEDPHTLHVGTMPNRAYFIPASTRTDTVGERRADSDRFTLLNGDWMFRYYASIYDLDAEVSRRHQAGLPAFHDRGFIDSWAYRTSRGRTSCAPRGIRRFRCRRSGRTMGSTGISTRM